MKSYIGYSMLALPFFILFIISLKEDFINALIFWGGLIMLSIWVFLAIYLIG